MGNEDYKKLRSEINNEYQVLYLYANITKGISEEDFNRYFQMWCNRVSGGLPIQICMNMILNYLDKKHEYVNK